MKKDRTSLRSYFVTNAIPTQENFYDLIDSALNPAEDGLDKKAGSPLSIQAEGDANGTQELLFFYKRLEDNNPSWRINQNPRTDAGDAATNRPGLNISDGTGLSRLYIKNEEGRIGIGTIEPQAQLHLKQGSLVVEKGTVGIGTATAEATRFPLTFANVLGDKIAFWAGDNATNSYGLGLQGGLLQIHTDSPEGDIAFGFGSSAALNETLRIKGNGSVGIGTPVPKALLDVGGFIDGNKLGTVLGRMAEGNGEGPGTFLGVRGYGTQNSVYGGKSFALEHSFYGSINSSINFFRGESKTGGYLTFNTHMNVERMRITTAGYVGIGIDNPIAPLHVSLAKNNNYGPYVWLANTAEGSAVTGRYPYTNIPISILATSRIVASEFDANSDIRIKKDFSRSKPAADLETVNQLQITDFRYKDEVGFGTHIKKGLIAQEVEKLLPQAISSHADFIPDIFAAAQRLELQQGTLTVTMLANHGLETGDVVRLLTPAGSQEVAVSRTDDKIFTVNNWTGGTESAFVYGKKVHDFRSIDYNVVFALGLSAIQELNRQLQAVKEELAGLKETVIS